MSRHHYSRCRLIWQDALHNHSVLAEYIGGVLNGSMKMRKLGILVLGLCLGAATPGMAKPASEPWDGLVEVHAPRMDAGFMLPGADFRPYTKVMLDRPEAAFRKNWLRDVNSSRRGSRRVTDKDALKILEAVQSNTSDIFTDTFNKSGYRVVTAPAPDVLRIRTGVINLYVNAPDTMSAGRSRTYTAEAGEATLFLEVRDSQTNALLARVLDRRSTRSTPGIANSVTNLADYRTLAAQWAKISVKGLNDLKSISPIPERLSPGQKLN
jgi:hypothetical protein